MLAPSRVGVVGGGIMGQGIAALFANAGVEVTLFDVDAATAARSVAALTDRKQKLPQLYSFKNARRITPASVDDYPTLLGACDAIVEVVPEILPLKQKVLAAIDAHRAPGSVVATNTSGLSIAKIVEGRSDDLRAHFLGTHYFHPVRHMPLVELIPGPDTRPQVLEDYAGFLSRVGKRPVAGRDTPNFIANRIGVYGLGRVVELASKHGLSIEEVDAITAAPIGYPKTASYRLCDLVGLDTLLHVATNSYESCPDDEVRAQLEPPALLKRLVEAGRLGNKSGAGFYEREGKAFHVLVPDDLSYRPAEAVDLPQLKALRGERDPRARVRAITSGDAPANAFARELLLWVGAYALNRVGEVADDIRTVDDAVKWGFGRELGPIETLDAIGLEAAKQGMEAAGIPVPALLAEALAGPGRFYDEDEAGNPRMFVAGQAALQPAPTAPGISLARLGKQGHTVAENGSARLVDLGDGVLCFAPDVRAVPAMNPIDAGTLEMLEQAHDACEAGTYRALVIGNDAANFCAGANLKQVLELAAAGDLAAIEAMTARLQALTVRGLHAGYPVVAAPHGLTLGGGLELALGAQVVVAHAELYAGLVEVGAGLVPAGGGCLRLLQRFGALRNARGKPFGPIQRVRPAFELIAYGKTSTSAQDAQERGLLGPDDLIEPSVDLLLARAKEVALARLDGFAPIPKEPLSLPGRAGALVFERLITQLLGQGQLTPHGAKIARVQARILTGGPEADIVEPVPEERILQLEREGFLELVAEPLTQARMLHLLETGKPLIN